MNKKRLIITSVFSIFLVAILLIGSTYSIFSSKQIDPNSNVYTTGNLDITYTLSNENINFSSINPMNDKEAQSINPYRMTVTNNGTVPYKFNLILTSTTSSDKNEIDKKYIMTKVGDFDSISLADCNDDIIKKDIILLAGESVNIDVRIWISDNIQNSEIGKSFYAKLVIDGLAVYEDTKEFNNELLSLNYMKKIFVNNNDNNYYKDSKYINKIINISFVDYIDKTNILRLEGKDAIWDISENNTESIMAWLEEDKNLGYYNLYIGSNRKIYAKDLSYLFSNMPSLVTINFNNLDTVFTNNMTSMFENCNNLSNLDLSNFNTKKVTSMESMFKNCNNLSNLNLTTFSFEEVTNTKEMFSNCHNLVTNIIIKKNKITDYNDMFKETSIKENSLVKIEYTNNSYELVEKIATDLSDDSKIEIVKYEDTK